MSISTLERDRVSLICGGTALLLCLVAVGFSLSVQSWKISGLVRMQPDEPMAEFAQSHDPGFGFTFGHYDGVYFYAIAADPIAQGEAHSLIDHPSYRYGHAGYGWLAFLVTAGTPSLAPIALLIWALIGAAVAGWAASRVAALLGWSPWAGLVVAVQPGLLYSVTVLTSEAVGLAVLMLALWFWFRERTVPAVCFLAFLCLIKEAFLFVPIGLFIWELGRTRPDRRKRCVLLGLTLVPAVAWWSYLRAVFDIWPFFNTASPLQVPPFGWIESFRRTAELGINPGESQVGTIALPILLISFVMFLVAFVRTIQLRTPIDPVFLLQALVAFSLSPTGLVYPKDFFRIVVVPFVLVAWVLLPRREES